MRVIIQAEALRRSEKTHHHQFIHELPTIDEVEVVHGRWIRGENWAVTCSVCGCQAIAHDGKNYCPNCGAKMDAKEEV